MTKGKFFQKTDSAAVVIAYYTMFGLTILTVTPFSIYYCKEIWKLRQESFFMSRYPKLTISVVISWLFSLLLLTISAIPVLFPSIIFGEK